MAAHTHTPIIPAPARLRPAEKAWGPAGAVTWPEHRDALAQHTRLWEQDGLTFFTAA